MMSLAERIATVASTPDRRILVAKRQDGSVCGFGELRIFQGRRAHAAGIDIAVDPERPGVGIESSLIQALIDLGERWYGIKRFEARAFAVDASSIVQFEAFDFVIEATHRRGAMLDGELADLHSMARLR